MRNGSIITVNPHNNKMASSQIMIYRKLYICLQRKISLEEPHTPLINEVKIAHYGL